MHCYQQLHNIITIIIIINYLQNDSIDDAVRGNAKTLINYVDGVQEQDIADLFADKCDILYNSVSYDNTDMVTLKKDIDKYIRCKRNNIESEHKVITVQDSNVYCQFKIWQK